jgi:pimeloyl-ACP methyl ester carboxylesterase
MGEVLYVEVDQGRLAIEVTGSGPPVVLVHGVPGSRRIWDELVARLVADGFRTAAVDLLGVGESSRPTDLADLWIDEQAAAVTRVLDQIGPAVLVGHNFGTPVSVAVADDNPQLVSGLVLSAGNLFTDTPIPFPLSLIPRPVIGTVAAKVLFSGPAQRAVLRMGVKTPGVRLDTSRYLGDRRQQQATARIFRYALTHLQEGCAGVEAALPNLAVSTRILWGERDLYFDLDTPRRAEATIPNATLHVEPGAGHYLPVERPDVFVDAITSLHQPQAS